MSGTATACEVCGAVQYPHFHSEVGQTAWNVLEGMRVAGQAWWNVLSEVRPSAQDGGAAEAPEKQGG